MPANVVSLTLRGGLFTRVVGKRILFFQKLSSTMDEAVLQAEAGAEEGTVVVAEVQTAQGPLNAPNVAVALTALSTRHIISHLMDASGETLLSFRALSPELPPVV